MMVLRLTRLASKPGQMPALREIYNAQIIPEIRAMKGHHSSHIMEGETRVNEAVGWIVWDEPEFADKYVSSGTFAKHMELIRPMLASDPFIDAFNFI
jgi:quinol monooxygenase YgiN